MNCKIMKNILREERIPYWKIAKVMHVSEVTIGRMLRDDDAILKEDIEQKILSAINDINRERHRGQYDFLLNNREDEGTE